MIFSLFLILLNIFNSGGESFHRELARYFDSKFSAYEKYEFEILQMPVNYRSIEIDAGREFKITKNLAYVPVKIVSKKKSEISSFLTCRVKLFKSVLKATERVSKNQELSQSMFVSEMCDVSLMRGTPVYYIDQITDCRSKVYISKNSFLIEDFIEKVPDVVKGDQLVLHTGKNGVDITLDVVSRQDGYLGEIIRVAADGNKIYSGKIIDKYNLALIEF